MTISKERLDEIRSWLIDDPDFYINCTERQATDAIRDLLADLIDRLSRELAEVRAENATLHADKLGLMQALGRFTGDA